MKKLLICLTVLFSIFLFNNKVSALETTSGNYPDIPDGFDNFIIASKDDGTIRLFAWHSSKSVYVNNHMDTNFYFDDSMYDVPKANSNDVNVYNLKNNSWEYQETTYNASWGFNKVIATTSKIYSRINGDYVSASYEPGYGLLTKIYNYQYDKKQGPLDKLYSIDYIFDINTFTENTIIQYEIDYDENYEKYNNENLYNYLYTNGFKYYGLVNNNGLYHWEELETNENLVVNDYEEVYEDGKYYLNITDFNLDFANYEKIIFRAEFFNDGNLISAVSRSNNPNISRDDVFYNTVFGSNYINIQINTANALYLDISSTLDEYNSEFYTWDHDNTNPYLQPYLNYYDLTTSQFLSEKNGFEIYYSKELNYDFLKRYSINIGKSTNKGVAITREIERVGNSDVNNQIKDFTYNLIFDYRGFYYSYNNSNTHENKIYIDSSGNWYQDENVPAYNTNTNIVKDDLLETFKDLLNNRDNNIFYYFTEIWNGFKNNKLYIYFMLLISGALIILIIKAASR